MNSSLSLTRTGLPFLYVAFALIIVLLMGMAVLALDRVGILDAKAERIDRQTARMDALHQMRTAVRERAIMIMLAALEDDPFRIDEIKVEFGLLASRYMMARGQLANTPNRSREEIRLFEELRELTTAGAPVQQAVLEAATAGNRALAHKLLLEESQPVHAAVMAQTERILGYFDNEHQRALAEMAQELNRTRSHIISLAIAQGVLVLLIGVAVVWRVHTQQSGLRLEIARRQQSEQALQDARDGLEREVQARTIELSRATEQLRDVLAAAADFSIIATDLDGVITLFNKGAEKLLGYTAEGVVGKQTPALFHLPEEVVARSVELSTEPGQPVEGFRVFTKIPERDGSETREWSYKCKDGRHVPVSLTVTALRNDSAKVTGYLGIAEDISERKRAETVLLEQAQHTQAILDNIVDGIITIDASGIIQSLNPAATRIFGYTVDEVLAQNVSMLMPSPHREAHDDYLRNYQSTGVARIIGIGREVEGRRKDGSLFPMELAVSEIAQRGQPLYVGMVRDITERKRMERMKSEFVSTVSHELRTPLTSISGALGLIAGGGLGELSEQAQQMIAIAHKNSQRLTLLINDLLDMEKIAAGKLHFEMQVQPLMPLIEQALESHRTYGAEQQVELVLENRPTDALLRVVRVRVDSQRLQQVLANLLSNAIKFSPSDGRVSVSVQPMRDQVRVAVVDQGSGIPEAFRARIFEKFSQADSSDTRQKGGTGLGLAITRELVERMGGCVGFDSVEGEGASFWFELPLVDPVRSALDSNDSALTLSNTPRILVVEDEPDVAEVLAMLLTRSGYKVDIAQTGQQALVALRDTVYDALTLDLMLPDISGLEVIHQLRQQPHTLDLPIIVVSARMEEGRLAINGDFSAIEWLAKPIDEARLLQTLEDLLITLSNIQPRILHVEDDTDLHEVIRSMVGGRFDFELASSLREARERLALERFDVIILDVGLPDGSGWELLQEIRARQPEARVVILSGTEMTPDEARKVETVLLKSQVSPRELLDALSSRIHNQTRRI